MAALIIYVPALRQRTREGKKGEGCLSGTILESRVTCDRTSRSRRERHRFRHLRCDRGRIQHLFGQTPEALVQVHLGVNAAQRPHRTHFPAQVAVVIRHATPDERLLQLCGVVSYVELFIKHLGFSEFEGFLLNITDVLQS